MVGVKSFVGMAVATMLLATFVRGMERQTMYVDLNAGETTMKTFNIEPLLGGKLQVYFLADTTGSMSGEIREVQDQGRRMLNAIKRRFTRVQFAGGEYKDFPNDPYAFRHRAGFGQPRQIGPALQAINAWRASGGSDGAEGQLFALDQISKNQMGVKWADDALKVIIWFGDFSGHDPVCKEISGLDYDITEESVIESLKAANIHVIAISTKGGNRQGLNNNPRSSDGDYAGTCPRRGSVNQAKRIALATDGKNSFLPDRSGGGGGGGGGGGDRNTPLIDAIEELLSEVVAKTPIKVSATVECQPNVRVTFQQNPNESLPPTVPMKMTIRSTDGEQGKCLIIYRDGFNKRVPPGQTIYVNQPSAPNCDACSYPDAATGRCMSACPGIKDCIEQGGEAFCVTCGGFHKENAAGNVKDCCMFDGTSCVNAAGVPGGKCTRTDELLKPNGSKLRDLDLETGPNQSICTNLDNFGQNRFACRVAGPAAGPKTCFLRDY